MIVSSRFGPVEIIITGTPEISSIFSTKDLALSYASAVGGGKAGIIETSANKDKANSIQATLHTTFLYTLNHVQVVTRRKCLFNSRHGKLPVHRFAFHHPPVDGGGAPNMRKRPDLALPLQSR